MPPCSSTQRRTESAAPLRIDATVLEVDAAHAGLRGEGDERRADELALADAVALLGEHDDRAAFGRLVGEARELRGVGELLLGRRR